MPRTFLYRCQVTGQRVQGSLEDEPPADGRTRYTAVKCPACGTYHFVNAATLRLLSEERPD